MRISRNRFNVQIESGGLNRSVSACGEFADRTPPRLPAPQVNLLMNLSVRDHSVRKIPASLCHVPILIELVEKLHLFTPYTMFIEMIE